MMSVASKSIASCCTGIPKPACNVHCMKYCTFHNNRANPLFYVSNGLSFSASDRLLHPLKLISNRSYWGLSTSPSIVAGVFIKLSRQDFARLFSLHSTMGAAKNLAIFVDLVTLYTSIGMNASGWLILLQWFRLESNYIQVSLQTPVLLDETV